MLIYRRFQLLLDALASLTIPILLYYWIQPLIHFEIWKIVFVWEINIFFLNTTGPGSKKLN